MTAEPWFAEEWDAWDVFWPILCVVCGHAADYELRIKVQTEDPKIFEAGPRKFYVCEEHSEVETAEILRRWSTSKGIKIYPVEARCPP